MSVCPHKSITTDPELKHAIQLFPKNAPTDLWWCVTICMGVSVFSRDAVRVSVQACLCKRRSQDPECFSESHSGGKQKKEHVMVLAQNSEYVWPYKQPTSSLCLSVSHSLS